MKRDQLIIFVLVGIMLFSAVATGLLFLAQDNQLEESTVANTDTNQPEEVQDPNACTASDDALATAGTPLGDWPPTVPDASELVITDVRDGSGEEVQVGDCITAHYRLANEEGPVAGNDTFESERPFTATLAAGSLIEGWVQGLPGMREGGLRRLIVPSDLAYGDGETLVFDVEVVKVENR
jgi:FKBP-type peptidyl-prolyl cis-trans isomerase